MASSPPPLRDKPRSYESIIVNTIFMALAISAVALRLWARKLKTTRLNGSDYAILVALFCTSCLLAVGIIDVINGGQGEHEKYITKSELEVTLKIFFAAEPFWVAACSAVKISVLCLYLTIFPNRRFRIVAYAVLALVSCHCLGFILRTFLMCRPIEYNWNKTIKGTCGNEKKSSIAGGISNMILDIIVIILPIPIIWRLQMAIRNKITITGIFGLGVFVCIISILRLVEIIRLNDKDLTYSVVLDGIWTFLEPSLGVVNACLPVLQPVLTKISGFSILAWSKNISSRKSPIHQKLLAGGSWEGGVTVVKDSRKFRPLDEHLHPLTDISATHTQITPGRGSDRSIDIDLEGQHEASSDVGRHEGIKVTKTWDLQS